MKYCRFLCFFKHCATIKFGTKSCFRCFLFATGHTFPCCMQRVHAGVVNYTSGYGCFLVNHLGERILGSSLTTTIRPVLHTGQRQGLIPVSLSNCCRFVSGGCCCFIIASISGFSSGVRNCSIINYSILLLNVSLFIFIMEQYFYIRLNNKYIL